MFTAQPRAGYAAGRSKTQCMPLSLLDARTTRVMLAERERAFLLGRRVARLASADAQGEPHVVPVCFALSESSVYITIDRKPKREGVRALKRLRNIAENPAVALVADHYEEDWSRLAWVMLRGRAEILDEGEDHDRAQELLRARSPQYREMALAALPVIAIRVARAASWGNLEASHPARQEGGK